MTVMIQPMRLRFRGRECLLWSEACATSASAGAACGAAAGSGLGGAVPLRGGGSELEMTNPLGVCARA